MDPLILSRWQFGLTTIYHFLFVPLTLGLGWFVAYMQTRYYRTRDEDDRKMAKFWGKLFLINFAIGVVTGIVQEFQFGMNWSEYSRYVGDIFGAPLAIEALLAFFLESTFLGIWVFGEGRVPEKVHLASIWIVAIASNFSALWILLANGWMQHPVGYVINEVTRRAELVDFFALITNPKGWLFFWHTIAAGFATASFLILGVSAYHLSRGQNLKVFKTSFQMAAIVGLVAGVLVFLGGHTNGQYMYETQPMKFAAIEAHWETSEPASFSILTIGRYAALRIDSDAASPRLLGVRNDGRTVVEVGAMSEGTTDQLFLALRLAAVEQSVAAGVRLPFLADDLFVNFDDDRSEAGFRVLAELARSTQVLFFTHHPHLASIARSVVGADIHSECTLG